MSGAKGASAKAPRVLAFGRINLSNTLLEHWECDTFSAGQAWNEVVNGTERGFLQTTGFGTWECTATDPVDIKNTKGETVPGVFLTAEGPPEQHSEKGHKSGNMSLPWSGELTEKEAGKLFVKTHNMKVSAVIPLCTEMGGTGEGSGCKRVRRWLHGRLTRRRWIDDVRTLDGSNRDSSKERPEGDRAHGITI